MEDHEAFVSLGEIYEGDRHRQVRIAGGSVGVDRPIQKRSWRPLPMGSLQGPVGKASICCCTAVMLRCRGPGMRAMARPSVLDPLAGGAVDGYGG